ncbi:MAG: hypothetical protein WCA84_12320 [Ignavibacteriaceae bacterium]
MEKTKRIPVSAIRAKLKTTLETNDETIELKTWDFAMWWIVTQSAVGGYDVFLSERKVTRNSIKESTRQLTSADKLFIRVNR